MAGKFFDGVLGHKFSESTCFLCGAHIQPGKDTVEHVIPKWVQSEFDLWNVRIQLLNGTLIKYRNLVIPCCQSCNNEHLAKVEQAVCASVFAGAEAVRAMDRVVLMQWLLKIFFGFLYREVFLPIDRAKPDVGTIVTAEDMEQFQLLHYMLQSVRVPTKFDAFINDIPASIFVFELKEREPFRFDYKDDVILDAYASALAASGYWLLLIVARRRSSEPTTSRNTTNTRFIPSNSTSWRRACLRRRVRYWSTRKPCL